MQGLMGPIRQAKHGSHTILMSDTRTKTLYLNHERFCLQ